MKKRLCSLLSLLLCVLLLVSMVSCGKTENKTTEETTQTVETVSTSIVKEVPAEGLWKDATYRKDASFGTGENMVKVTVEAEGKSVTFTLYTDQADLGKALLEFDLVEGEEGAYGLYVKKVNGITADYDVDQSYWSFEKNGEMQMVGVSDTPIVDGEQFELVYTK